MGVDRATFPVRDRTTTRDGYLRTYQLAIPAADVGQGSQPYVQAGCVADAVAPIYADALYCAKATDLLDAVGKALDDFGETKGRARKDATGSQGYVIADTVTGGALISEGTELRLPSRGTRFRTTVTNVYTPGDLISVESVDAGSGVNVVAGATLTWTSPPAGVRSTAIVFENTNGAGITGGAPAELDDEYRAVLLDRCANPPAAGNWAHYAAVIEDLVGLGVQKAFVYPCWNGPGTVAIAFTMRPAETGASRIPNGAQLASVEAAVKDSFPADDGIVALNLLEHEVRVSLKVAWKTAGTGWVDQTQWPAFYANPVLVTGTPTNSTCRVTSGSTIAAPVVGQTIGFWDSVTGKFKKKRISAVSVVAPSTTYDLTFDTTTLTASDSYVPIVGQIISPWSPSLQSIVEPVLKYGDKQGPGEMFASFGDVGSRQRRQPAPTSETYPSKIEQRILDAVFPLVEDADVAEPTTPFATTVGTPGASVYLHVISDIGVFPL
jgi:uncharacterized phage protein gp47/JayE